MLMRMLVLMMMMIKKLMTITMAMMMTMMMFRIVPLLLLGLAASSPVRHQPLFNTQVNHSLAHKSTTV